MTGYRRKGEQKHQAAAQWSAWLKENSALVEASGLPTVVISDEDHWLDFLDYGILDHHDDPLSFNVDQLSVRQKAALLRLLMTQADYLRSVVGWGLLASLLEAVETRYKD